MLAIIRCRTFFSCRLLSKNLKIKIYGTIILPVVLYGCETWLLTLREERRLRLFENKVLRRIFGPRRDEVTGEWRRLHNKEIICIALAKHLNEHAHCFGTIDNIMQILHHQKKGPPFNTLEWFHIHKEAAHDNHLSDNQAIFPNRSLIPF